MSFLTHLLYPSAFLRRLCLSQSFFLGNSLVGSEQLHEVKDKNKPVWLHISTSAVTPRRSSNTINWNVSGAPTGWCQAPEQRQGSQVLSERWKLGFGSTWQVTLAVVQPLDTGQRPSDVSTWHGWSLAGSICDGGSAGCGCWLQHAGSKTLGFLCNQQKDLFFFPPSFPSLCIRRRSHSRPIILVLISWLEKAEGLGKYPYT